MSVVGVVGSGAMGGTVARLAVAAGWKVRVSNSRGPASLTELVASLGPAASAVSVEEAASCDVVVVSVPVRAFPRLPLAELAGRTVIDTSNYSADRDGPLPAVARRRGIAGWLASLVPEAVVAKGFSTIHYEHLAVLGRPAQALDRSALPTVCDHPDGVAAVGRLYDDLGFDVVSVEGLDEEWRLVAGQPAFGRPYAGGVSDFGSAPATPAGRDVIDRAVAAAWR